MPSTDVTASTTSTCCRLRSGLLSTTYLLCWWVWWQ
jgi:hypothetical protein